MGKIDVSTIEGYSNMSAEEKLAALESYEFTEPKVDDKEMNNLKGLLSKRNSEINKLQDELKAKRTADEQAEAEKAEKLASMESELAELRKAKALSTHTAKLMEKGFDAESAKMGASFLVDGDFESFYSTLGTVTDNISKSAVAKAMDDLGGLSKGKALNADDAAKASENAMRKAMGLPPKN